MADIGINKWDNRPAESRIELNERVIRKHKLKLGKVLKVIARDPDDHGYKKIKKAKIICMHPYFITCANVKNPNIRYTLYYFDLENNIA